MDSRTDMTLYDAFHIYIRKKEYQVDDYIVPDTQILFLMESPNKEALQYHIPATGMTGKFMMSEIDNKIGCSFGEYIKRHSELGISIMNVSTTVWQKGVMIPDEFKKDRVAWRGLFDVMYLIKRVRYIEDLRFQYQMYPYIVSPILSDFNRRLTLFMEEQRGKKCEIIVCGQFAKNCLKYLVEEGFQILPCCHVTYVKHPAYNWWKRAEKESMEEVRERLREIIVGAGEKMVESVDES